MANGVPLTIGNQPSLLGAFASGRGFRQQQEDREAALARAARLQELRTQLGQAPAAQPAPQLGAEALQLPGEQPALGAATPPIAPPEVARQSRADLQRQFEAEFPEEAAQLVKDQKAKFDLQTDREKQRDISITRSAAKIQGLPVDQRIRILEKDRARFQQQGITDLSDTDEMLGLLRAGDPASIQQADQLTDQAVQFGQSVDILKDVSTGLSPLQKKVAAEGINPNSPEGFARAKELNQRAATDPSLKPSDQQILAKASEGQLAAAGFANRVQASNVILTELEATEGFDPAAISADIAELIPGGNIILSDEQQRYRQAKLDFITAVLRKESGAAIGKDEEAREDQKFFPQLGDSAAVKAQKARARARAFQNLDKQSKGVFKVQFENPEVFEEPTVTPTRRGPQPAPTTGQELSEGAIIRNPQTGQRLQVVNGQLVDI